MFAWLQQQWTAFTQWIEALPPRTAAVLGAAATAVIAVLWQTVLFPLLRAICKAIMTRLYPLLSSALVLDRVWALPKYLNALRIRVSHLSNPWLDEAQKLTEIFVPVSATTDVGQTERVELSTLFRTHRTFVVIGEPGSGKTTGLKSIALGCLNGALRSSAGRTLVPVFIPLRQLAQSKLPLDDFVTAEVNNLGFPKAGRLLRRLESKGRLVFLLDGLDEVDEADRPNVIAQLAALLERQHQNKDVCHVVVTSRPVGYDEQLRGHVAATVRMADFNLSEIRKFVDNWEFRPPKSRERLLSAIADRRPIFEICKNPLMLTIVTSLYRDYDYTLPDSREEFYRVCVEALLRKWDEAKNMDERNKIKASYKQAFLEEFAFTAIEGALLDFRETYLLSQVELFLDKRQYKHIDATRFMAELLRSGLLSRLPTGEIFFAHKTLAESLAALHLRNQSNRLVELWKKKPDAWLEVCSLFVADPKTAEADIVRLLDAAKESENWNHLLILAGEAHFCPDSNREWIVAMVVARTGLWRSLDVRAISALARLGEGAPKLLSSMADCDEQEVRIRAIHALGTVSEEWAIDVLGDLLIRGVDSDATANALAGMGSEGIAVVTKVIERHRGNVVTVSSCLNILEQLGTVQALETAMSLLWDGQNGEFAALTCAGLLSDEGVRRSFEAMDGSSCPQAWREDTQKTAEWALPSMDDSTKSRQRALYARVIDRIGRWMITAEWEDVESLLQQAPPFLVIPAAITAIPGRSEFAKRYFPLRDRTLSDFPLSSEIVAVIESRPTLVNQKLWAKAVTSSPRIQLGDDGRQTIYILLLLAIIFFIPLGAAMTIGAISVWWSLSLVFPLFLGVLGFSDDKDFEGFAFGFVLATFFVSAVVHREMRAPGSLRTETRRESFELYVIGFGIVVVVAGVYAMWALGGLWWLGVIPLAVTAGLFNLDSGRFALPKRANPIATFRARFEGMITGSSKPPLLHENLDRVSPTRRINRRHRVPARLKRPLVVNPPTVDLPPNA